MFFGVARKGVSTTDIIFNKKELDSEPRAKELSNDRRVEDQDKHDIASVGSEERDSDLEEEMLKQSLQGSRERWLSIGSRVSEIVKMGKLGSEQ